VLVERLCRVICLRRAGRQVSSRKLFVSPSLTKLGEKRFRLHGPLGIEQPIHGTVKTGITGWNVREDVNIFFVFFTAGNFIRYTLLDMEIAHPDNCIIQDKRRFFRLSKFDVCVAITPVGVRYGVQACTRLIFGFKILSAVRLDRAGDGTEGRFLL